MQIRILNFRSGQDLVTAGIRGDVQLLVDAPTLLAPQVVDHALHAIVVTGNAREDAFPEVPTVAELGFPAAEGDLWIGLVGPRGLPQEVATRLNDEIATLHEDAVLRERLRAISFRPMTATPAEFAELIRHEHERWSTVIRDAGLKLG
jgi:tripartite-type tricarboxylate transporter receptor subunit TctC